MRSLGLSRYALSSCAAAALLAGCGVLPFDSAQGRLAQDDTQPPIGAPGAVRTASSLRSGYASLYSFKGGSHGQHPNYTLTALDGALYGVTSLGGTGCGTAFRMTTGGADQPLYEFKCGGADGMYPESSLAAYRGVLYGTTLEGGAHNAGTVFALTKSGREHVIYNFKTYGDGNLPSGNLVITGGKLYGTTQSYQFHNTRGYSLGCVFSLTLSGKERILHVFSGGRSDGSTPSGLVAANGALYGTTSGGGTHNDGTVFTMSTTDNDERVLHSFSGTPKDGAQPAAPPTWWDGALYGTTLSGGSASEGTIYEVSSAGKERIIHNFDDVSGKDGSTPLAALIVTGDVAYGTTQEGGVASAGTIFRISAAGHAQIVYSFGTTTYDGRSPAAALTAVGDAFYGTASYGGLFGLGNFFRFTP